MGSTDVKNDIKVLFFIVNSFSGLLGGLLTFSYGVASVVKYISYDESYRYVSVDDPGVLLVPGMNESYRYVSADDPGLLLVPGITRTVVGLITLGLAALGYAGAILQNRIMLFIFAGVMVLGVIGDITSATFIDPKFTSSLVMVITHLGFSVLAVILAVILAMKAVKQTNQGMILSPPPAAYTPVA